LIELEITNPTDMNFQISNLNGIEKEKEKEIPFESWPLGRIHARGPALQREGVLGPEPTVAPGLALRCPQATADTQGAREPRAAGAHKVHGARAQSVSPTLGQRGQQRRGGVPVTLKSSRRAPTRHCACAGQIHEDRLAPEGDGGMEGRLTIGLEVARRRWSTARFEWSSERTCTTGARSGVRRSGEMGTKWRRRPSSQREGTGGGAAVLW
jgi:hypothetical protein